MSWSKRSWGLIVFVAAASGLVWTSGRWWDDHRYQRALAQVEEEIDAGHFATARRDLAPVLAWKPSSDQAAYLMGVCERNSGRADAAAEWWARVRLGSPFGSRAIQGRMELEVQRGRLAEAERIVEEAAVDSRVDGSGCASTSGRSIPRKGAPRKHGGLSRPAGSI